jgi:hypothetical protein
MLVALARRVLEPLTEAVMEKGLTRLCCRIRVSNREWTLMIAMARIGIRRVRNYARGGC